MSVNASPQASASLEKHPNAQDQTGQQVPWASQAWDVSRVSVCLMWGKSWLQAYFLCHLKPQTHIASCCLLRSPADIWYISQLPIRSANSVVQCYLAKGNRGIWFASFDRRLKTVQSQASPLGVRATRKIRLLRTQHRRTSNLEHRCNRISRLWLSVLCSDSSARLGTDEVLHWLICPCGKIDHMAWQWANLTVISLQNKSK